MSKMYYAETPDAAHDIHDLKVNLLGESFQFYTDAGVFSKKMIDYGSQVLLSALDLEAGKHAIRCGLWLWSSWYQFSQGTRSQSHND